MTGPEGAVLMMAMLASVAALIAGYDWWTRRKDRPSSRQ